MSLSTLDSDMEALRSPQMQEELSGIIAAYRGGMPQTCKVPGVLWYFAVLLTGRWENLTGLLDDAVEACRGYGYDWELAYVLQLRSRVLNDRRGRLDQATRDADEALRIFLGLGDAWGASEALAGRGETAEKRGEYEAAARDFKAAMVQAEELGAHGQTLMLRARLGGVMTEVGRPEEGERMLREVLADAQDRNSGRDAVPFTRMALAVQLSLTGRTQEARRELLLVREAFASHGPELFLGLLDGLLVALDVDEGQHGAELLPRLRQALELTRDPLTEMVDPDLPVVQLLTGARVLVAVRGAAGARDAARLIGAFDALRAGALVPALSIREGRSRAEAAVRALLADPDYTAAHAEGGGLSLDEAAALL